MVSTKPDTDKRAASSEDNLPEVGAKEEEDGHTEAIEGKH